MLCCHIPPAVPELLYDTVARRFERGSEAVLEAIRETQPRYVLFGHVHQPLVRRTRIGRTECVNVGHFRARGAPYVLGVVAGYAPESSSPRRSPGATSARRKDVPMADRTSSSITINAVRARDHGGHRRLSRIPWMGGWHHRRRGRSPRAEDGRAEKVRITLEAGPIKDTYVLAYDWAGDDAVHWNLAEAGTMLTGMTGAYRLHEADGSTEVTYELAVDVRIPMIGMVKRKAEKRIIETALKGLKRRVEA